MIGLLTIDIFIPMSSSLKDKRSVISSIREKCRNKYNVAVAEMDQQDRWKNSTIGIVTIGNRQKYLEQLLTGILDFIEGSYEIRVTGYYIDFY